MYVGVWWGCPLGSKREMLCKRCECIRERRERKTRRESWLPRVAPKIFFRVFFFFVFFRVRPVWLTVSQKLSKSLFSIDSYSKSTHFQKLNRSPMKMLVFIWFDWQLQQNRLFVLFSLNVSAKSSGFVVFFECFS